MDKERIIKDAQTDTDLIIDGISKLPYSKQIGDFNKSSERLEESKEKFKEQKPNKY